MKPSISPTKPEIDDLQHQVSQQRKTLETYKAENKALKDEIEARTKVSLTECQHAKAQKSPVSLKCSQVFISCSKNSMYHQHFSRSSLDS